MYWGHYPTYPPGFTMHISVGCVRCLHVCVGHFVSLTMPALYVFLAECFSECLSPLLSTCKVILAQPCGQLLAFTAFVSYIWGMSPKPAYPTLEPLTWMPHILFPAPTPTQESSIDAAVSGERNCSGKWVTNTLQANVCCLQTYTPPPCSHNKNNCPFQNVG